MSMFGPDKKPQDQGPSIPAMLKEMKVQIDQLEANTHERIAALRAEALGAFQEHLQAKMKIIDGNFQNMARAIDQVRAQAGAVKKLEIKRVAVEMSQKATPDTRDANKVVAQARIFEAYLLEGLEPEQAPAPQA